MRAQGRGYAPRVSPALPSWLRKPSARTVDALVVLAWIAASLAAGAWRTKTREI